MADADLVLAKVATVERCLRRIDDVTHGDPQALDDQNNEDVFVLNLQRAVQATIDLANHLVAAEGLGLPATLKEAFVLLERGGDLPSRLSARMQAMVGFRNIAVHDYQTIDRAVLKAILRDHLADLRDLCRYAVGRGDAPARV